MGVEMRKTVRKFPVFIGHIWSPSIRFLDANLRFLRPIGRTQRAIGGRATVAAILLFLLGGCSEIDWNWDWWKPPRRVVRPVARRPTTQPQEKPVAKQPPPSQVQRETAHIERAPTPEAMSSPDNAPRQTTPEQFDAGPSRAFYHLYLASGATKPTDDPEHRLPLSHAGARTCARLLEMLYVPVGRSGSEAESYLLYENRDEFQAAWQLAPALDVAPVKEATSTVGAEAAFRAGVGLMLHILESGATIPSGLIEGCERKLSEAAQADGLPVVMRWASAIMAGRLVSEYRYDYATARNYYLQAERLAANDPIAVRTARWWKADAFVQEGKRVDAGAIYEEILDSTDIMDSQIVRRSKALLAQHKKR